MTANEFAKVYGAKTRDLNRVIKQKEAEIATSHKKTVEKLNAASEALSKSQAGVTQAFSQGVRDLNLAYMDVQDAFRKLEVPLAAEEEEEPQNA